MYGNAFFYCCLLRRKLMTSSFTGTIRLDALSNFFAFFCSLLKVCQFGWKQMLYLWAGKCVNAYSWTWNQLELMLETDFHGFRSYFLKRIELLHHYLHQHYILCSPLVWNIKILIASLWSKHTSFFMTTGASQDSKSRFGDEVDHVGSGCRGREVAGTRERNRSQSQEHELHGFFHLPLHQRRGSAEEHPGSFHSGRLLCRGGCQTLQDCQGILETGSYTDSVV